MATRGLSLVGFMDQAPALTHLKTTCIPKIGTTDADLIQEYAAAVQQIGGLSITAGACNVAQISASDPHIVSLANGIHSTGVAFYLATGAMFAWVDIDPLLAFQHIVDLERSDHHCNATTAGSPTPAELMNICLPTTNGNDSIHMSGAPDAVAPSSIVIKSRSLNLNLVTQGVLPAGGIGITFGWNLPFVHVVEYQGRCVLYNGYHRAVGCRLSGATRIPCLFRTVSTAAEAGFNTNGSTFDEKLMMSAHPPTVAHFVQGRALDVTLRAALRIITVQWAQHTVYDE